MLRTKKVLLILSSLVLICAFSFFSCSKQTHWYKGNLHAHSFWSDGDDYPEMVMSWYEDHGYNFMVLSDHNILAQGEKWIDVSESKGGTAAYNKYIHKYGEDWVEQREVDEKLEVRLKTLEEYKSKFNEPGEILLIQSEEITDHFSGKPVHLNALNIQKLIKPQNGNSIQETIQRNVDVVLNQQEETSVPILLQLNHPNFRWAITAEDLTGVNGVVFFEIYNGHPSVRNYGDELHPDTERIWDIILSVRLREDQPIMYGIATDDAHDYHNFSSNDANPGRGWVMVESEELTPEALITAMEAGNFYSSTGVEFETIDFSGGKISIKIKPEDGISYTTQFISTRKNVNTQGEPVADPEENARVTKRYSDKIGEIFQEVKGKTPGYKLQGDELYVRAKVISSKSKENPYRKGDKEVAWIQPFVPK